MVLKLLALLLIPITLFSGCDKRKAQLRQTSDTDSTMLEEGRVGDLRLKIYYITEEVFFIAPLSVVVGQIKADVMAVCPLVEDQCALFPILNLLFWTVGKMGKIFLSFLYYAGN